MTILVTGGAGFIGSNVVAALNGIGADVVINDTLGNGNKWRNIAKRRIRDFVFPEQLTQWLDGCPRLDGVVHLGAIADTQTRDADAVIRVNFQLSMELLDWCQTTGTPFIYASSAATYGDGSLGFHESYIYRLRPLNLYGWSKHLFDLEVMRRKAAKDLPGRWSGLKFFNVYGPNEYHKGDMTSLVHKIHDCGGFAHLLYEGKPQRDFIYVGDVANVVLWALGTAKANGILNVGTGVARSFRELAEATLSAMGFEPEHRIYQVANSNILAGSYQHFTQADITCLRQAGYDKEFMSLEDGVLEYVTQFLDKQDRYL